MIHVRLRDQQGEIAAFEGGEHFGQSLRKRRRDAFEGLIQQQDVPTRFVLVEVYRDTNAAGAHKETKHYPVWRDAVAPMKAEPRHSVKFNNLFPDDEKW